MNKSKQVYFAECIGPDGRPMGAYKIGCSHGHEDRLKQICSGLPFTLELRAAVSGDMILEKVCHLALKAHRISGEYFHASAEVVAKAQFAANKGRAFSHIEDLGERNAPDGAIVAFLKYHGVEIADVCELLGVPVSQYEKRLANSKFKSRNIVAAAALIAARRGHYVRWPTDAMHGLLGEFDRHVEDARKIAA